MDKKISQFAIANSIVAGDLIPIVDSTVAQDAVKNKSITVGLFASNLPNVGNKGISKDLPVVATPGTLVLTSTIYKLSTGAYTLPAGVDGQTITLVATAACTVSTTNSTFSIASFSINGIAKLRFISGIGWIVESSNSVTIA